MSGRSARLRRCTVSVVAQRASTCTSCPGLLNWNAGSRCISGVVGITDCDDLDTGRAIWVLRGFR
eukprot:1137459-Pyramimonas_sp.AAC.1